MSVPILLGSSTPETVVIITDTAGLRKTDVVWNTASLALWYRLDGGSKVDITTATLATVNAAYSSGGFIHIADGEYRLCLPSAAAASGTQVTVGGSVPSGVVFGYRHPLATATPTASENADAVRAELATELGRLDVNVSSRMATFVYTAAPTASDNATQVRTELATELARIDVAISTRMATFSYTAPLDAAGIRTAVGLAAANMDVQLAWTKRAAVVQLGAISNAGTAVEAYTLDGVTVTFAGLDVDGNRSGVAFT